MNQRTDLTIISLLILFLSSCGVMQESAYVVDDVYYDKDVTYTQPSVTASTSQEDYGATDDYAAGSDDYYNKDESALVQRNYYDVAYNDPRYYNYDRFGWNASYWGMSMGNPMGPGYGGYGGYYNTGSYLGGGSSFYGYDPFGQNASFYYHNPWASPYANGAWGSGYSAAYSPYGYSPYSMYGNPYMGYGNPYGGFYDPYYGAYNGSPYGGGYYGGGYCPPSYYGGGAYTTGYYGHRNSLNAVAAKSNNTPRLGREGAINLRPSPPTYSQDQSRTSPANNHQRPSVPDKVTIQEGRKNTRLEKPTYTRPTRTVDPPASRPSRTTTSPSRSSGSGNSRGGSRGSTGGNKR